MLEQALDVSQIDELNQAGQPGFQEGLRRLGTGAALVQAAPDALERWLGLPLPAPADQRPGGLLLALRPDGRSLRLSGLLELPPQTTLPEVGADGDLGRALRAALHRPSASLAVVQDPAVIDAIPLLQPLLNRMTGGAGAAGPLPALVVGADAGPLLAAASGERWLLGTAADRPAAAAVEASLAADGLIAAPLDVEGRSLQVWTRLRAGTGRRDDRAEQLQAPCWAGAGNGATRPGGGSPWGSWRASTHRVRRALHSPRTRWRSSRPRRRPCSGPSMVRGPATCWPPGSRGSASPPWPEAPSVTRWRGWPWP